MKILLAVDGSACSTRAAEEVARRPWPGDSQVRVVCVVEPPAPLAAEPYMLAGGYFEEAERLKRREAATAVADASALLAVGEGSRRLGLSTDVLTGSPRRRIVEEAEAWGADLVVVGSHGSHTWERMLLGSVSQAVAAHAPCSVEVVRCRQN